MMKNFGVKIGFHDKNGKALMVGHRVKTFDSKGKEWIGKIVPVDPKTIAESSVVKNGGILYAFKSNYETWINDQEYASELEIVEDFE